jgi:hypothetical protein
MQGRLASYTASYLDIGEVLIKRFFASIADTDLRVHGKDSRALMSSQDGTIPNCFFFFSDKLSKLKPQDLANTCWAFAVLGLKHNNFLDEARHQLVDRTNRFLK